MKIITSTAQFVAKVNAVNATIRNANGTFVTVKTRTNDGRITVHNGRTGVRAYAKSGVKPFFSVLQFTLFCPHKGGYRTVNANNVISITSCGRTTVFEGKGY